MHFYQGYTLSLVLKEPATWFFSLLSYSYKVDAEEKLKLIGIIVAPHSSDKSYLSNLVREYKSISRDIIDVLQDDKDYSNIDKLKKILRS